MYIQQLYTNCLAQAAYYIESNGEAAIIDPLRDIDAYLELAHSRHTTIKYIFETHFHADFVSGHIDLAKATGAKIIFGPEASPHYEAYISKNKERFKLGTIQLEVLHTPGHTIESICILVYDEKIKAVALFSGDTLFAGDVGRPDLLSGNFTAAILAARLYDSLHQQIIPLADDVIVYPGHGPGSACGKKMSKETITTIGAQKQFNYALQAPNRASFIKAVTSDQVVPPAYFFTDAIINKEGYGSIDSLLEKEMQDLNPAEFSAAINNGALVLDVRNEFDYALLHVKDSIHVGINGSFAIWVGTIIPVTQAIILICETGKVKEAFIRLARVGFENILGYWEGSILELKKEGCILKHTRSIEASAVATLLAEESLTILDVRTPAEFQKDHLQNAINYPLNEFKNHLKQLQKNTNYLIYCAAGYRSMIACSMLEQQGFQFFGNCNGGMAALKKEANQLVEEGIVLV